MASQCLRQSRYESKDGISISEKLTLAGFGSSRGFLLLERYSQHKSQRSLSMSIRVHNALILELPMITAKVQDMVFRLNDGYGGP